ncbi:MAG TPA: DUF3347 domain-containing protein [Puia sp.]|nr:DUF3347 domain-containing protein [Puia sp.]
MKRVIMLTIIVLLAGFTAYKLLSKKETVTESKPESPLMISKNSEAFNLSFGKIMTDYFGIKDALVDWDTTKANRAARSLIQSSDSLKLNELKADSSVVLTAENYASSISNEAKGFIGETSIEQKRHAFNMLTSEVYDLVRVVKYDKEVLYHIKCPMAFNDSLEAYWMSNTSKVINPYLGKKHPNYKDKMLGCGEVVDSLDFSKR